jgi:hypothetical protein
LSPFLLPGLIHVFWFKKIDRKSATEPIHHEEIPATLGQRKATAITLKFASGTSLAISPAICQKERQTKVPKDS